MKTIITIWCLLSATVAIAAHIYPSDYILYHPRATGDDSNQLWTANLNNYKTREAPIDSHSPILYCAEMGYALANDLVQRNVIYLGSVTKSPADTAWQGRSFEIWLKFDTSVQHRASPTMIPLGGHVAGDSYFLLDTNGNKFLYGSYAYGTDLTPYFESTAFPTLFDGRWHYLTYSEHGWRGRIGGVMTTIELCRFYIDGQLICTKNKVYPTTTPTWVGFSIYYVGQLNGREGGIRLLAPSGTWCAAARQQARTMTAAEILDFWTQWNVPYPPAATESHPQTTPNALVSGPNPVRTTLTVPKGQWRVYDVRGRERLRGSENTVDVSGLPNGLYLLRQGTVRKSFLVSH